MRNPRALRVYKRGRDSRCIGLVQLCRFKVRECEYFFAASLYGSPGLVLQYCIDYIPAEMGFLSVLRKCLWFTGKKTAVWE